MGSRSSRRSTVIALTASLCLAACSTHVSPPDQRLRSYRPAAPFQAVLGIAEVAGPEDEAFDPFLHGGGGLARALGDGRLYRGAVYPYQQEGRVDVILRGEIAPQWRDDGLANFLTWFPGGLAFSHSWRGNRYEFGAVARVELIDARTGERIAEYWAETWRELVDRSANPAHFLGAALVVPGVLVGSSNRSPDAEERRMLYDAVYAELWERIATAIARDREPARVAHRADRWKSCGQELGAKPRPGISWARFRRCQTDVYEFRGREPVHGRLASVYEMRDGLTVVYVVGDEIVQWRAAGSSTSSARIGPSSWTSTRTASSAP